VKRAERDQARGEEMSRVGAQISHLDDLLSRQSVGLELLEMAIFVSRNVGYTDAEPRILPHAAA
jgi:hypothetical protein